MDSATQFNSATETGTMQLIEKNSKSDICCCNWVDWRYRKAMRRVLVGAACLASLGHCGLFSKVFSQ
ncbi:hypothetical protein Cni_G02428 [Canna indica]|uniref:Uncharacterized protein n=1 Tax=Canna indica TaxID=4628 RepID=A0AAQ3Q058_9LILI|nr:hypothetical protein Cni_G02428 [Canna indica]